jgi:hypothetical protein
MLAQDHGSGKASSEPSRLARISYYIGRRLKVTMKLQDEMVSVALETLLGKPACVRLAPHLAVQAEC